MKIREQKHNKTNWHLLITPNFKQNRIEAQKFVHKACKLVFPVKPFLDTPNEFPQMNLEMATVYQESNQPKKELIISDSPESNNRWPYRRKRAGRKPEQSTKDRQQLEALKENQTDLLENLNESDSLVQIEIDMLQLQEGKQSKYTLKSLTFQSIKFKADNLKAINLEGYSD